MPMLLTSTSVIHLAQLMLVGFTASFLLWGSWQPGAKRLLLRLGAATMGVAALALASSWATASLPLPWADYARFWSMPLVALMGLPVFMLVYHLPEWNPDDAREVRLVFLIQAARLLYEGYWLVLRSVALATEGRLINQRPLLADLIAIVTLFWLIVTIVRRMRYLQRYSGEFIAEAVLLMVLLVPSMLAQSAFNGGWITRSLMELIRDLELIVIIPLTMIVFLDLLRETVTLLVRMLGVALSFAMVAVSASAALLGPIVADRQILHAAMLRLSALTILVTLLVVICVPLLLKRGVFRPLEAVLAGVRQLNQGNLDVVVPVTVEDEIGLLTSAFNRMVSEVRDTVTTLEERVQARTAELAQSELRYRELVEQIDEVIFRIAVPDVRVEYVSPSIERLLGFPSAALQAAPLFLGDQLHPDEVGRATERAAEYARGIVVPQYEYRVIDAQGQERWLQQSNTGVYADGRLVAIEGICRDVTEARHAEGRLLVQERELAALRERERIGRDLHDGLGQIIGYVNLQAQTAVTLIAGSQLSEARSILTQLVHIAQDAHTNIRHYILDLRLPETEAPSQTWSAMLRRSLCAFEQNYGITVQLSCPASLAPDPFPAIVGYEVLQIMTEALNNVYKHAGVSVVQVVVQQVAEQITLVVSDNGVGFTPGAVARRGPGREQLSGMGLHMMGERVALINASLQIDSAPGAGTQVVLRVPLRPAVLASADEPVLDDLVRQARVMLVDDHKLFREGMRTMLAARGVQVVGVAEDGLEAQQLARQLRPDIVLMDMQMPRCDGLAATTQIKAELPETKILMLTVAAEEENLYQALKAGASGYLLKNLDSDEFFKLLTAALRGEVALSPSLATLALDELVGRAPLTQGGYNTRTQAQPANSPSQRLVALSPRQRDILERAAVILII